jgi:mevalonate kinase
MWMYKASAPGSLMLLGEYAVLHDYPALVCAIDKRISVIIEPIDTDEIEIVSRLGSHKTTLQTLDVVAPFAFVLATLKLFQKRLPGGCKISITSDFSHEMGFASSAAVTVATLAALTAWLDLSYSPLESILLARNVIQSVQGMGSGADVAACTLGGVVAYRMQPLSADRMSDDIPLTVIYSGSKTPTVDAITHVNQVFAKHKHLYKKILQAIGECAAEGMEAVKKNDLKSLGHVMNIQQGLMHALQVNTPRLQSICDLLNASPDILGAKISGSGLGDCVVGLGHVKNIEQIATNVSREGVMCEKIRYC